MMAIPDYVNKRDLLRSCLKQFEPELWICSSAYLCQTEHSLILSLSGEKARHPYLIAPFKQSTHSHLSASCYKDISMVLFSAPEALECFRSMIIV